MPRGGEPIGDREAKVVSVELDESALEGSCSAKIEGELVSLKLESTTQSSHTEIQYLKSKNTN